MRNYRDISKQNNFISWGGGRSQGEADTFKSKTISNKFIIELSNIKLMNNSNYNVSSNIIVKKEYFNVLDIDFAINAPNNFNSQIDVIKQ